MPCPVLNPHMLISHKTLLQGDLESSLEDKINEMGLGYGTKPLRYIVINLGNIIWMCNFVICLFGIQSRNPAKPKWWSITPRADFLRSEFLYFHCNLNIKDIAAENHYEEVRANGERRLSFLGQQYPVKVALFL